MEWFSSEKIEVITKIKQDKIILGGIMKKLMFMFALILLIGAVWAQTPLLYDDFTGLNVANLAGQSSWTKGGTGPDPSVANTSALTYIGYNGGGGEYVQLPTPSSTASRVYKGFTSGALGTNTFYYSALIRLSATTATGEYFMSLGDPTTGTTYFARLFAKSSGSGFVLGVSKLANVATASFGSTVLNLNQTYLVVVRYTGVTGTNNDLCYLWVNPSLASEPEVGSAYATVTGSIGDATPSNVGNFHWHNRNTTNNSSGAFDAVRVSSGSTSAIAWTNLSAAAAAAGDPTITVTGTPLNNFGGVLVGDVSGSQSYFVSGTDLTANITVTAPSGFEISLNDSDWDVSFVLTQVGGEVEETEIFVRFIPENSGITSVVISHVSDGAATVDVTVSGTGLKGDPSSHVSGFSAQTVNPTYSSIQLTWVDSVGDTTPDGYLIKGSDIGYASINAPVDGVAEVDAALIKNVNPGVQSYTFTTLSGSTSYFFKIFPYTNSGSNVNYLTTGIVPSASATTDARPWVEDFETGLKTGYPSATVTMNGYDWNMTQALIGDASGDIKLGLKAARLRYDSATSTYGSVSLLTPKTNGIGTISFYYARSNFSGDRTGVSPFFVVEYSSDMENWTQIGDETSLAGVDVLTLFSEEVNITGSNHVRIRQVSGESGKRWNVDNIAISDYVYDYPEDTPVVVGGNTIQVGGGNANNNPGGNIPEWANNNFVPSQQMVLTLLGAGPWTVTITTDALWGAYHRGGWNAVQASGGQIVFEIEASKDLDLPIILGDEDATLPVELSSFAATMTANNFVSLMWITQSETNVNGYYIYRSKASDLSTAVMVSPMINATNTSSQQSYVFVDREVYDSGVYFYWLQSMDIDGNNSFYGPVSITVNFDENGNTPVPPLATNLNSIYPNPFNPSAFISYSLASPANVNIRVYNSRGQLVRNLMSSERGIGHHEVSWNGKDDQGSDCGTGIYFIRMDAGKDSFTRKALMVK